MNDAKSTPFAYMINSKNPCIPPKVVKKPLFGKLREIRQPFFNLTPRNGNLKFYSELCKIRSIHQPTQRITQN